MGSWYFHIYLAYLSLLNTFELQVGYLVCAGGANSAILLFWVSLLMLDFIVAIPCFYVLCNIRNVGVFRQRINMIILYVRNDLAVHNSGCGFNGV